MALSLGRWWCPLGRLRGFRTCRRLALVLWWRVPSLLSAFLLCLWCVACKYGSISRFKGVFRGFWGVDVYLYGLRALRGLQGFCVREWLGGFVACGVFTLLFVLLSFCLSFSSLVLLSLLSCFCALALPFVSLSRSLLLLSFLSGFVLVLLVLLFPFRTNRQKEGAQRVVPCVLASWVVGCFIWLLLCTLRTRPDSIR